MKSILLLLLSSALCAQSPPPDLNAPAASPEVRKDTIVVTGSYEPVPLDEADRSIGQIRIRGETLLYQNILDAFRFDPALDLRQRGASGSQADLSIRGATVGQTLVLVNGMRVNDAQSAHHNLNLTVPLDSVQSVEVLRGAGSSIYGSDAVGGVVNLVTAPPESSEIRLRAALGSYGINEQSGSIAGVAGKLAEQLSFARDFSSGFRFDRDYRDYSLASGTSYRWSPGATGIDLGFADRAFGADQFYGNYPSWERTKTWFTSLRQGLGERTEADFGYRHNTDLFVLFRDQPWIYTNHHSDESWQASLRRREPLGRSVTLFYGAEGIGESIDSTNLGHHSRARAAGYASLDVRVLKRFSFSAGLRDEVYHGMPGELSPSVSAGYWASAKLKFRASVSRAFRLPGYTDLYYRDPANLGNPNLRPERAWSYEGGLDYRPGGHWRLDATVFERRDRNLIDYSRASINDIWRALNVGKLDFLGVEAGAAYQGNAYRLDLRYSALDGSAAPQPGLQSKYAFNYPVHSALAGWTGRLPGGILARTRVGAMQRFGRDAYAVWDIQTARSTGRVRPFLQLANICSTGYQEISGVVMPGRTITGGLEIAVLGR